MSKSKKSDKSNNDKWALLLPQKQHASDGSMRGRPHSITPRELELLRTAFLMGCDDDEACAYAEITRTTLYNHQKVNKHFLDWKEAIKQAPFLKARKSIIDNLERDPEFALKYMERKKKKEFSPKAELTIDDQRAGVLDEDDKAALGASLTQHLERVRARASKPVSNTD